MTTDSGKKPIGTLSHAEVNVTCPECEWVTCTECEWVTCPECEWPVRWTKMTPIGEICLECEQDYLERKIIAYDNNES